MRRPRDDRGEISVLLIEDDPDQAELIAIALAEDPWDRFRLRRVEALKDGVAEAAANPPDIILLDLGLPDSNGVETMQRLQAELPEVPVIVLTGIEDEDLGIQAIRSHAQDYLTKSLASGHVLSRTIIYALERSSLRRHLVRADRLAAVGELAAGIAHEVNNPAAFVMANLEVMRDDVASVRETFETLVDLARRTDAATVDRLLKKSELPRKLADWTDIVDESYVGMERIRVLIRDLRTFSRIEAFDIEPVSVNDVVNSACNMLQHELRQRVRLGKDLGDVPLVAADRRRLEQVITNLIINAMHAIDRGDADSNEVRVKTHVVDDEVVIQVEDTGCGVPDDLKDRIFEPFFTTKARDSGTGLGLSLSADIVAKLGGRIAVTDRPGGGSIFAVSLPVSDEAEALVPRASAPGAAGISSVRARILVIDDEPLLGRAYRRRLEDWHDLVVAEGGPEGLSVLMADQSFDVILCDIMMPDLDGPEVFQRAVARAPHLREKFIFLTAGAFTDRTRAFLASVDNPRLDKPLNWSQLLEAISERIRATLSPAPP